MNPCSVKVLLTKEHVILTKGSFSLWCSRDDGRLLAGKEPDYAHLDSTVDLGQVWACIGKIRFFTDGEWKLLLISHATSVGVLPHGGEVFCVDRIAIIPLTRDPNPEIIGLEVPSELAGESGSAASNPTLGVKIMKNLAGGGKDREKPREKVEKRLTEALLWMFNDSRSFYFSMESDLTQSLQREQSGAIPQDCPTWKRVDERFFWNRWMISDLLDDNYVGTFADQWIIPLIQGYVEVREVPVLTGQASDVAQGLYHLDTRHRKKESDLYLKVRAGGEPLSSREGDRPPSAMIEMTEMVRNMEEEEEGEDGEENAFKAELELAVLAAKEDEGVGSGYESDSESAVSCCTDDMLNDYLGNVYGESSDLEKEVDRESDSAAVDSLSSSRLNGRDESSLSLQSGLLEEHATGPPLTMIIDSALPQLSNTAEEEKGDGEGGRDSLSSSLSSRPLPTVSLTPAITGDREAALERQAVANLSESDREQDLGQSVDSASGTPRTGSNLLNLLDSAIQRSRSGSDSSDREDSSRSRWKNPFLSSSPTSESTLRLKRRTSERKESTASNSERRGEEVPTFTLAIISRRSRYRAGTRYKRRGVDAEGHVANYVETEMLVQCGIHVVSYVIVRGSVPVYWTQPGYKYRPLPIIERDEQETQEAFKKHFDSQLQLYNELALVNLVKQTGREQTIAEAYEDHVLLMDSPDLTYIAFDFHQHYKNNQAAAIRLLLRESTNLIKKFKFCWLDSQASNSLLCKQEGVFRVNCMDCLDRTNVVESVYAREVLQTVLQKLGVISFEEKLNGSTLLSYQELWGNNGDTISRQYAGTAAMKGDITRYGERKISGLMKDGYNSAHRYYLNVFRDTYRQVLIDLMQGQSPADAFASLPPSMRGADEALDDVLTPLEPLVLAAPGNKRPKERLWSLDKEQDVTDMIQKCRQELYPNPNLHVQCWAMMEAAGYSFLDSSANEEICILMQCREHGDLTVANYSSEVEQVVCFIRVPMSRIEKISVGTLGMILRSTKRLYMRILYSLVDDMPRYFTLKTINFTSMDEDRAILLSIATALEYVQPRIIIHEQRLTKKKSPPHPGVIHLIKPDSWLGDKESSVIGDSPSVQSSGQLDKVGEELEGSHEEEEEEEEPSNSLPSSPKLSVRSSFSQAHSRSFDDLLSSVNNEVVTSPTRVASPRSPFRQITPKPVHFHPLESGESGSDSEIEMAEFSSMGKKRVSATNPLSDHGLGENLHNHHSESDTEKSGDERSRKPSSESGSGAVSAGKFAQLKGKFFQRVSSLKPPMSSLRLRPSSRTQQNGGDSDSSVQSQPLSKFLSVRRGQTNSSSDVFGIPRGRTPPRNEPSEEELRRETAMKKSRTKFLILKAV